MKQTHKERIDSIQKALDHLHALATAGMLPSTIRGMRAKIEIAEARLREAKDAGQTYEMIELDEEMGYGS